jgi:hypothetical protein
MLRGQVEDFKERVGITREFVSLQDFVQARLESGQYEARLGLMHQADRDFQELTRALATGTNGLHQREKREFFPRGPARVVLYIDDLDRCPPEKVVEVFEAVQLLLSKELFVVVLGLDTRYITRALETEYEGILIHHGEPSGLDYIEKIIQIPYRIRPVQPGELTGFLSEQMDFQPEESGTGEAHEIPPQAAQIVQPAPVDVTQHDGDQPGPADPEPAVQPEAAAPADQLSLEDDQAADPASAAAAVTTETLPDGSDSQEEDGDKPEPLPDVIQFNERDFEVMRNSCQHVQLTPRSVKRLTNVYKLMITYWYRHGVLLQQGSLQTMTNLLVLAARYPEITREVFEAMEDQYQLEDQYQIEVEQPPDEPISFDEFWEAFIANNELLKNRWDRDKFVASVKALDFKEVTFSDLGRRNFNLVRSFSFVGDFTFSKEPESPHHHAFSPALAPPDRQTLNSQD